MNKFLDSLSANIFNIFLGFLIILNALPIIAPIARYLGLDLIADIIYAIYSFTCHQFHWRSLHIAGYQIAWCARDTFIWGTFMVVSICYKLNFLRKPFAWYWIIPFTIPIALDGGIQTIATLFGFGNGEIFYLSTNLMRMITGTLFGIGLGVVISPYLKQEQESYAKANKVEKSNSFLESIKGISDGVRVGIIFISMFLLYIILVQVWKFTTPAYPPVNFLDSLPRKEVPVVIWTNMRAAHGKKNWQ